MCTMSARSQYKVPFPFCYICYKLGHYILDCHQLPAELKLFVRLSRDAYLQSRQPRSGTGRQPMGDRYRLWGAPLLTHGGERGHQAAPENVPRRQ
jgi:hypothetical protein